MFGGRGRGAVRGQGRSGGNRRVTLAHGRLTEKKMRGTRLLRASKCKMSSFYSKAASDPGRLLDLSDFNISEAFPYCKIFQPFHSPVNIPSTEILIGFKFSDIALMIRDVSDGRHISFDR